jgi:hypothetical protein
VSYWSGSVELLLLCLLFGAGRFFIFLLDVYASFVDGSFSPISAALVLAVRDYYPTLPIYGMIICS